MLCFKILRIGLKIYHKINLKFSIFCTNGNSESEIENLKKMIEELRDDVDRLTAATGCCLNGTETEMEEKIVIL